MNHRLMRRLAFITMLAGLASASMAGESVSLQAGTDRMGADYKTITMTQADPQICRQACADDGVCKSYSYVKPGVKGPDAMCFLKSSAVPAVANACCTSGAKTTTYASVPSAATKNTSGKPSLNMGTNLTSAADPQQLLKAVNELKAQAASQQQTIAELASLIGKARDDIQAMKAADSAQKQTIAELTSLLAIARNDIQSISKTDNKAAIVALNNSIGDLNTSQVALKNLFINFKNEEYANHYHNLKGILGNVIEGNGALSLRVKTGSIADEIKKIKKTGIPAAKE